MDLLKSELVPGDPPRLQLDGEIDLSTADALRAAIDEATAADPRIVVDMGGVTFFDAVGLRVVLQAAAARNGAGPLRLVNAARVERVLEIVGLSELPSLVMGDAAGSRGG
jgi:anti-anti-sigma factor